MKFTINREQLLPNLQQIVSVIEKRQTMPILSNVLIVVDEGQLVLTGTDLEIQIIAKLDNLVDAENGEITVPARKFFDLCKLLPTDAQIRLETAEDKVKLSSGRSRFSLSTLPADNYPQFSESDMPHQISVSSKNLKKALSKVMFCMANQDVRYYLNGMMLNVSNSKLKFVASDGHRLAMYHDKIDAETNLEERLILPRKAVHELAKLLDDSDEMLEIQFSENNVRVSIRNLVFSAKLVDAKYPDFNKVFEKDFLTPISVSKQAFKEVLTRVSVLANERFKGVTFDIAEHLLKVTTHNPDHDEAEEEVAIDYAGDAISIAFNATYLLDAIANLDGDTAQLMIATDVSTLFMEEPGNETYRFVVMPMRL